MIGHRASLFNENSALFFHKNGPNIPLGMKSSWANRAILGIAKLANFITPKCGLAEFESLVLRPGATSLQDEFIEVQVFGELTVYSFESVRLKSKKNLGKVSRKRKRTRRGTAHERAVKEMCVDADVKCEIV